MKPLIAILLFSFLPALSLLQAQEHAPLNRAEWKATVRILEKMEDVILPSVEFEDLPLFRALSFLEAKSAELSPDGIGISIRLDEAAFDDVSLAKETCITLRLTNVPLKEAIRYTTNLAQTMAIVSPESVVVLPLSAHPDGGLFQVELFDVPAGLVEAKTDARAMLEEAGIEFPEGAMAKMVPGKPRMAVRNQSRQLHLVKSFLKAVEKGERESFAKAMEDGSASLSPTEQKLKEIVIPKVDFADTPFSDAIGFLQMNSVDLDVEEKDPGRKGVNVILEGGANIDRLKVTLRLTGATLGEAFRYTTALAGFGYTVEGDALVLRPLEKK